MACPSMHELQAQLQSLQAMYASIPTPSDSRHKRRQGRSSLVASKHVNNLDCGAVGGDSQEQNQKQKTPQVSLELSREHSSQTSFSQGCARETGILTLHTSLVHKLCVLCCCCEFEFECSVTTHASDIFLSHRLGNECPWLMSAFINTFCSAGGSSSDQQRACAVPSVSKGTEVRTCRVREDGGGRKRRVRKQTKQASKQWAHDFGGGAFLSSHNILACHIPASIYHCTIP
jgi:hypothetical protein